MQKKTAVVLFSGGLDSTVSLYWARRNFESVEALIIDYQQKHALETRMARTIASRCHVRSKLIKLPLGDLLTSALTDESRDIPDSLSSAKDDAGIPFTYVPFRNGIFLSVAAGFAESRGIYDLVTGFNRIDTPDYPDTTEVFSRKMEDVINCGTGASRRGEVFSIHTPLIGMTKDEIILMGVDLNADLSYSISCYRGGEMPCGRCPSCDVRARAFEKLNMEDPLIRRLKEEK